MKIPKGGIGIDMKMKNFFFDKEVLNGPIDRAKKKNLSKSAARIRNAARWSMKKKVGPSRPGMPPHRHVGTIYRMLWYAWDNVTQSAVIGPVKLHKDGPKVLTALEMGGTTVSRTGRSRRDKGRRIDEITGKQKGVLQAFGLPTNISRLEAVDVIRRVKEDGWNKPTSQKVRRWQSLNNEYKRNGDRVMVRRVKIKARPYMTPALIGNLKHIQNQWRDSIAVGY